MGSLRRNSRQTALTALSMAYHRVQSIEDECRTEHDNDEEEVPPVAGVRQRSNRQRRRGADQEKRRRDPAPQQRVLLLIREAKVLLDGSAHAGMHIMRALSTQAGSSASAAPDSASAGDKQPGTLENGSVQQCMESESPLRSSLSFQSVCALLSASLIIWRASRLTRTRRTSHVG